MQKNNILSENLYEYCTKFYKNTSLSNFLKNNERRGIK